MVVKENPNRKKKRISNSSSVIIGQVNINSIRNKLETLCNVLNENFDILVFPEINIVETIPEAQFCVKGYSTTYGHVSTSQGGGILLCVQEDIPSKLIKHSFENTSEGLLIDINLRRKN